MARVNPENYIPTVPPIEFPGWHRWIDGELQRISKALQADPVIFAIDNSGLTIGIDTTPTTVILGINDTPIIDFPGGAWDPVTGEYTVAQSGLYSSTAQCFIAAFGPGNKTYQANIEVFVNNVLRAVQITGGADDVPLSVNISATLILEVEDVVRMELTTLHEQFTGSSTYAYNIGYQRQAGG